MLRWGRQNDTWFGIDRRLTEFALMLHPEIVSVGIDPRDDEAVYLAWIDEALVDHILRHPSYEERKHILRLSYKLGLSPVVFAIERRRLKRLSKK